MNRPAGEWRDSLLAAARAIVPTSGAPILRAEVDAGDLDPLAWVAAFREAPRGYWADRDGRLEVAAAGEADEIKGSEPRGFSEFFNRIAPRLFASPEGVRYYGGFRFGSWHRRDLNWRPFGGYRFLLPRIEAFRAPSGTRVAANLIAETLERDVADLAALLAGATHAPGSAGRASVRAMRTKPGAWGWRGAVRRALKEIESGSFQKVVLARRTGCLLDRPVDAIDLLRGLQREAGRGFQFCGCHASGLAFIGISPERLYRREGRAVWSDAVAGTCSRGEDAADEARRAGALRASAKDRVEHDFVVTRLRSVLEGLCETVDVDAEPSILRLGRVQHLHTRLQGVLREGVGDAELLQTLHPTPATAGEPADAAMQFLAEIEPFDRGWYAGPVGWVSRDAAEFAVALRCGVLLKNRAGVFAGAGIVPGSNARREAAEIEVKMSPFFRALESM